MVFSDEKYNKTPAPVPVSSQQHKQQQKRNFMGVIHIREHIKVISIATSKSLYPILTTSESHALGFWEQPLSFRIASCWPVM